MAGKSSGSSESESTGQVLNGSINIGERHGSSSQLSTGDQTQHGGTGSRRSFGPSGSLRTVAIRKPRKKYRATGVKRRNNLVSDTLAGSVAKLSNTLENISDHILADQLKSLDDANKALVREELGRNEARRVRDEKGYAKKFDKLG